MAENNAPQQLRSNFPRIAISSALPQQMSGVSGQAHFQIGRGYQITPPNPSDVGQGYLSQPLPSQSVWYGLSPSFRLRATKERERERE